MNKKVLATVIAAASALGMMAGTAMAADFPHTDGTTLYVLGPTPDHGWTSQAGVYAQQLCEEITASGDMKAVYMAANNAEEQVDQISTLIANGDAAGVTLFAMDVGVASGEMELAGEGIPFIAFDRIMEETKSLSILNYSGNNWQAGASIAHYMQDNGLEPGDTWVTLYGDTGIVCGYREEGIRQYLKGEIDYYDKNLDETYHTTQEWTDEELDALFADYSAICDWSQDKAYEYMAQKTAEIVKKAKENNGKLFICSFDDEMTFGVLNLLEGSELSDETKKDFEDLYVCISAIGGMEEIYEVMRGNAAQSALADQYFDDLMSVFFSPTMIQTAINYMKSYLEGNWEFEEMGAEAYEDVWAVTRDNADQFTGFTGH